MKFVDYYKREDMGMEHIFTLFKSKRRSFIQLSVDWNDYPSGVYLQISIGNNRLFDILFYCWRFGFNLELFGFTWRNWHIS